MDPSTLIISTSPPNLRIRTPPSAGSPHPRVPLEIVDHIIDEVQDDKLALKSCSLASSSLLALSRKRLFGRVTFSGENKARYEDFYHLALTNPQLPTYVRGLRVDGLTHIRPERTILPTILKLFANLRSLSLVAGDYTTTWDSLGLQLQAALLDLIRSAPLTHVYVNIISWPLNSFFHCRQLRELVVPFPAFKDPIIPRNAELISRTVGFRVLNLGGCIHELCSSFGTSHPSLRNFTICCWSLVETTICQAILRSAALSLEELHVKLRSEDDEPFPALPNLQRLSVLGKGLKVIRWLVRFLRGITKGSKLRVILVSVSAVAKTPRDKIWGELNALVAAQSRFPDLSLVKILFDGDLGLVEEKRVVASFSPYLNVGLFELTSPAMAENVDG